MRVFVSWSGTASHEIAKALKTVLPIVIPSVEVFLSSEDIEKGARWFTELEQVLAQSRFAILCLTPENVSAPWILYEAGAVANRLGSSSVAPLLLGVGIDGLGAPLGEFNAVTIAREDMEKLFESINKQLDPGDRQADKKLSDAFELAWPRLVEAFAKAKAAARFTYDVFLSTPMAAFTKDVDYKRAHSDANKVFRSLKTVGLNVYWAAQKIESIADFDTLDISAIDDLNALEDSRYFVLILRQKLATSSLFEAGYALALRCPSHYFVRNRKDLPFLMRELPQAQTPVRIHEANDWKDYDDLARKIVKNKDSWFPD